MKTKSKLVLGLSILSAATLAAGVTSTFAWYTAQPSLTNSDSTTKNITSVVNNVDSGAATLTASVKYYDFDNNEIDTTAVNAGKAQQLLPAINGSTPSATGTPVVSGTYDQVTAGWGSFVKNGGATYARDTANEDVYAAYIVITYTLDVTEQASTAGGNYVITLTAGKDYANYSPYLKVLIETLGDKDAGVGGDSFAQIAFSGTPNNVRNVAIDSPKGTYSFRVIIWADGKQINGDSAKVDEVETNLAKDGISNKEILKAAAVQFTAA